jgi:hypothetical protein
MYDSGAFDEADMKEWEKKNEADKNDWDIMKDYFEDKMKLNNKYHNNNEGNEATLYGSTANVTKEQEDTLADMGDQIREYIQQITGAKEKENVPPPTTSGNKAVEEMNKRMTKIEELLTNMTFANNRNNGNRFESYGLGFVVCLLQRLDYYYRKTLTLLGQYWVKQTNGSFFCCV